MVTKTCKECCIGLPLEVYGTYRGIKHGYPICKPCNVKRVTRYIKNPPKPKHLKPFDLNSPGMLMEGIQKQLASVLHMLSQYAVSTEASFDLSPIGRGAIRLYRLTDGTRMHWLRLNDVWHPISGDVRSIATKLYKAKLTPASPMHCTLIPIDESYIMLMNTHR